MELTARQTLIADAAVAITARGGARALTHRAVDQAAGLPAGSSSYYARTRQDLLKLTVQRITDTTAASLNDLHIPSPLTIEAATDITVEVLQRLGTHTAPHRARLALLLELDNASGRAELTAAAPIRIQLLQAAEQLLTALGVETPAAHRTDLVGLIDALLLYGSLDIAPVNPRQTLRSYLAGLLSQPHEDRPKTPPVTIWPG